jgi:hypothetical protein
VVSEVTAAVLLLQEMPARGFRCRKRLSLDEWHCDVGAAFVDWSHVEQIDPGEMVLGWNFQAVDALLNRVGIARRRICLYTEPHFIYALVLLSAFIIQLRLYLTANQSVGIDKNPTVPELVTFFRHLPIAARVLPSLSRVAIVVLRRRYFNSERPLLVMSEMRRFRLFAGSVATV